MAEKYGGPKTSPKCCAQACRREALPLLRSSWWSTCLRDVLRLRREEPLWPLCPMRCVRRLWLDPVFFFVPSTFRCSGLLSLILAKMLFPYSHLCVCRMQDTVTGFILSGIGAVDRQKNKNFLVVDNSAFLRHDDCDFPFGETSAHSALLVEPALSLSQLLTRSLCLETPKTKIEETFKKFTSRDDIAVLLISQNVSRVVFPVHSPLHGAYHALLSLRRI